MSSGKSVIIIGSGLGGLECGVILARHGFKVIVLEQDRQIGGCLQTFVRKGSDGRAHTFDTGFHYAGGLDEGQPLHTLFKYFGLSDLPWSRMDEDCFDEVSFIDNGQVSSYPLASGHKNFVRKLSERFPGHEAELESYASALKHIGGGLFDAFSPDSEMFGQLGKSASEFIDNTFSDARLRDVVCGSTMKMELDRETLPLYVYAQVNNSFIESSWRLGRDEETGKSGGTLIINKLASQLRAFGGEILTGMKVNAIRVSEDGAVSCVEAGEGNSFRPFSADWVISDVHPAVTVGLIEDCRQVRKVFRNRVTSLKNTFGMFTTNMILKPGTLPYMNRNLYVHKGGTDLWRRQESGTSSVMVHFYPPENPDGKFADCIDLLSPMNWEEVGGWADVRPGARGEDYDAVKRRKLEECLELANARIPGIRDCIDKVWLSTPLTWNSYVSTPYGSAFGVTKDFHNPLLTFMSPRTPLRNLLFTGQSLNLHGLLGVTKTAFMTCGCILGNETAISGLAE